MKIYKWQKKPRSGHHSFRFGGKKFDVSPGQVVECSMDALGAFTDKYDCIAEIVDGKQKPLTGDPVTEAEEVMEAISEIPTSLRIISRGGGWYDVINPDLPHMPLNDKPLRKSDAEALL
jgi:hypothetical protein